ncbi:MAG: TIGR00282 family metallophosphoesterase [Pseudomonadota bacterium]
MKLGFFGDVVGEAGRRAVETHLPRLKADARLDFVVVNAENAAGGFGITEATADQLFAAGADCLTLGNHAWDQREALTYILRESRLLRVSNYPQSLDIPGRGADVYGLPDGRRVGVISIMGRVFMDPLDDPFQAVERELEAMPLGVAVDALIVDIHAEATSEKMAMGHFCDGRASLVVGTHTHVPTADAQILPGGTAYQTDAGMCGDYLSVVGMQKEISLQRFTTRLPGPRNKPAEGQGTLSGVVIETNDRTGLAVAIEPVRIGGRIGVRD